MTNYDKQRQTYHARFMNYLQIIVFKFLDSKCLCRHGERKQNNFTYVKNNRGSVDQYPSVKSVMLTRKGSDGLSY